MDKLFRAMHGLPWPRIGNLGAMTVWGLKDTSSRPAKDLGGPCGARCERRRGVMKAVPAETGNVPSARDAWQMWRENRKVEAESIGV